MAHSLIEHKPVLPIYTLNFNDTKYNVYFEQLGSELNAVDASLLEEKLNSGVAMGFVVHSKPILKSDLVWYRWRYTDIAVSPPSCW